MSFVDTETGTSNIAIERNAPTPSMQRSQNRNPLLTSLMAILMFGFLLYAPGHVPDAIVQIVLGVVPAIYMTAFLVAAPDALRDRKHSLFTASCLVAFLWIVALACSVSATVGVIH